MPTRMLLIIGNKNNTKDRRPGDVLSERRSPNDRRPNEKREEEKKLTTTLSMKD